MIPSGLEASRARGPSWAAWLDGLPALVHEVLEDWQLDRDGEGLHGHCALVLPVRTAGGRPAVLKLTWPHPEAEHEHLALKRWAGNGAVELLRADPHRRALLLERLHTEDLGDVWDVEACETVGGLYQRLHVPALPQLRTLSSYVEEWTADLDALSTAAPIPRRLVRQAASIGHAFAGDPATNGTLIHGDLHYGNVLAADREPWLVIDPKPVSGDAHYEPATMLFNRYEELNGDYREGTRRRFHTLVDVAGLDEHRARDWVVFRMICLALDRLLDPPATRRRTSAEAWLTMCLAVAKAVQD